jgi:alginate O-acetyltransferase complex protein AlgI
VAFYSIIFIFFIIIAVVIYYLTPIKYRKFLLLAYNYLFYSYFDYRLTFLLFAATLLNYIIGNLILSSKLERNKGILFSLSLVCNLLILGFFKYYNFFIDSINSFTFLLGLKVNLSTLDILLPLGISYYTFQTLTYVFDIYYGSITERTDFIDYAVFASFFALITSGPIERASTLIPQIKQLPNFDTSFIKKGFALIVIGMFRKLLIADPAGQIVNQIFSEPQYYRSIEILVAIFLYAFQLYNDFAGYSSIARGVAKLFGLDVISNFKQPFFSISITDFWLRWHRSFSFWLRDYLFLPLQAKFRNIGLTGYILAVMITFIICGLWHGATWGFVLWGFIQGLYISFSRLTLKLRDSFLNKIKINQTILWLFRIIFTFGLSVFGFFILRSGGDLKLAKDMIFMIVNWSNSEFAIRFLIILFSIALMTIIIDLSEIKYKSQAFLQRLKPELKYAIYFILCIVIILTIITPKNLPFIYEQF